MRSREHRRRVGLDRPLLQPARRSRSSAPAAARTPSARLLVRNLVTGDFTGRVYAVNPSADRGLPGMPAYKSVSDIPDDVDVAIVAVPAEPVQRRRARLRRQGRARPGRDLLRLRRDRRGGPAAAAHAGRPVPLLRPAADRPQLPRRHQHRPGGLAQRLALAADAGPRPGRASSASPARSARRSSRRSTTAGSASRRSSAPATAPTCPATTCCSTGRRTTPPRSCCSTSSRSATRASSPGSPAGSRCASRSSRSGPGAPPRACRWATPCARSRRRSAAVDAMFRQAGVIQVDTLDEMFDVAQLLAHQPLPRGPPGRRSSATPTRSACWRPTRPPRSGWSSTGRSRSAPTRRAEDFEDALDDAIDDPEVDSVIAVYIPPLNVVRRGGRQRARRGGGAVRQAAGLHVPRRRGRPRAAPRARRRRLDGRPRARCRRTRPSRPRCARSPGSSSTPCGCAPRTSAAGRPRATSSRPVARRLVNAVLIEQPEEAGARPRAADRAARRLRHRRCGRAVPVAIARGGGRRGRGASAGTWCSRRPREHLRERPDLAHVWRNIDGTDEMRERLGHPQRADPRACRRRLRGAEERAARRAGRDPVASRTRCSGRSSPSASPGR